MTTQTIQAPIALPRVALWIGTFVANLGHALAMASGAQARFDEIQRLQALSDAQLATRGLKRDEIVRHVYADLMAH